MRFFDEHRGELIYLSSKPTPEFWDYHWNIDATIRDKICAVKDTFVSKMTQSYLSPGDGIILEGGCGWGQHLASLLSTGYTTVGVDYASKTVTILKKSVPELKIILGDVRKLPFHDNSFAGYWSLGVIEHFLEGYRDMALEMFRVIKDNGYLFVTFPYMCPLRRIKGKLGLYESWVGDAKENFHQFALNCKFVVRDFKEIGFELLKVVPHDAITGIVQEIKVLRAVFERVLDCAPDCKWAGYVQTIINKIMSRISGHCVLLIFKKNR